MAKPCTNVSLPKLYIECVVGLLHTRMCHSESVLYAQTENVKSSWQVSMRQALGHAFYILACFEQFTVIHRLPIAVLKQTQAYFNL